MGVATSGQYTANHRAIINAMVTWYLLAADSLALDAMDRH